MTPTVQTKRRYGPSYYAVLVLEAVVLEAVMLVVVRHSAQARRVLVAVALVVHADGLQTGLAVEVDAGETGGTAGGTSVAGGRGRGRAGAGPPEEP